MVLVTQTMERSGKACRKNVGNLPNPSPPPLASGIETRLSLTLKTKKSWPLFLQSMGPFFLSDSPDARIPCCARISHLRPAL